MKVWEAALEIMYQNGPDAWMHADEILAEIKRRQRKVWNSWEKLGGGELDFPKNSGRSEKGVGSS